MRSRAFKMGWKAYSARRERTGFSSAARKAWDETVTNVIMVANPRQMQIDRGRQFSGKF
ncbi:hypothetical protein [Dyadobacter psychrophilus]|uniref:hypothetical protein n=1 Tax=Dyadobacter psychrophilus TaxID=651661 RepID=UPI0014836D82|nr:hypothetical protein [Dyadobacter psychrophilus]